MTLAEQQEWLRSFLSRHRVSRRTALKDGAGALAALGLVATPWARNAYAQAATAQLAVIGRRLSFGAEPTQQMMAPRGCGT